METPDGPDGSCAGDAPEVARARRRPRLRPRPATPPPPPPPPSPSRGACTRACRACSARAAGPAPAPPPPTRPRPRATPPPTPTTADGSTPRRSRWRNASGSPRAARASAVGPRPTEADRGWATGTRRETRRRANARGTPPPPTRRVPTDPHSSTISSSSVFPRTRTSAASRRPRAPQKPRARRVPKFPWATLGVEENTEVPPGKPTRPRCSSRTRSTVPVRSTTSSRFASRTAWSRDCSSGRRR